MSEFDAYLDIETTGLSWFNSEITVIGIFLANDVQSRVVQLVGNEITPGSLLEALTNVNRIYTYNGNRFDIPFINKALGVNLEEKFAHHDLMYDCWQCNLYGGYKVVEQRLGIPRQLKGITGFDAVLLWRKYCSGDRRALDLLLDYNREDTTNLKLLREKLQANFPDLL